MSYDTTHISKRSDGSQDTYLQLFPFSATESIPLLIGVDTGGIRLVNGTVLGGPVFWQWRTHGIGGGQATSQ